MILLYAHIIIIVYAYTRFAATTATQNIVYYIIIMSSWAAVYCYARVVLSRNYSEQTYNNNIKRSLV